MTNPNESTPNLDLASEEFSGSQGHDSCQPSDFLESGSGSQEVEFAGAGSESELHDFFDVLAKESLQEEHSSDLVAKTEGPAALLQTSKEEILAAAAARSSVDKPLCESALTTASSRPGEPVVAAVAPKSPKSFWGDEPLPKGAPKISAVLTLNPEVKVDAKKAPSLNELAKTDLSKLENADAILDPTKVPKVEPDYSLWQAVETGEAFPTRRQLTQALGLVLLTGLCGCGIGYTLFVKRKIAINVPKVDRQAAEKAPPLAYRSEPGAGLVFSSYGGATQAPEVREEGPDLTLKAPNSGPKPVAVVTASPTPKVLAVKSEDDSRFYPGRNGPQAHVTHRNNPVPVINAPAGSERPTSKGWVQAWSEAKQACVTFNNVDGPVLGGVIVRADGMVLTCLSRLTPDSLSRVVTNRGVVSGRIVQKDPEHDVALVQLSGSGFQAIPLCPEAPATGSWLLTPNAYDPQRNWQQQVVSTLSNGGLRLRGAVNNLSAGWPLVNDRAEVVAISLGRPFLCDADISASSSASTLKALLEDQSSTGAHRTCNELFEEMFKGLPSIGSRARPTTANNRAVPGEAMGNYPLGLTRQQLVTELGSPEASDVNGPFARLAFPTHHLVAFMVHDQVVTLETDNLFYTYGRGVSPGALIDATKFQSEFPGAVFNESGGRGLGLAVGFEVESSNGKITKLRVVPK